MSTRVKSVEPGCAWVGAWIETTGRQSRPARQQGCAWVYGWIETTGRQSRPARQQGCALGVRVGLLGEEVVDEGGDVGDGESAVVVEVGNLDGGGVACQEVVDEGGDVIDGGAFVVVDVAPGDDLGEVVPVGGSAIGRELGRGYTQGGMAELAVSHERCAVGHHGW